MSTHDLLGVGWGGVGWGGGGGEGGGCNLVLRVAEMLFIYLFIIFIFMPWGGA